MGLLRSKLLSGDTRLESCAVLDDAHLTKGVVGEFVFKVQTALAKLEGALIEAGEISANRYGPTTARAVLAFKQKRSIINPAYQTAADDIVGKMTIVRLDAEMAELEKREPPPSPRPAPRPLTFEETKKAIASYLAREAKTHVGEVLLNHPASLLVFGEVHFAGDAMKAFVFSELTGRVRIRRPLFTHFHASERFLNDHTTRREISDVVQAQPFGMDGPISRLSSRIRPFVPILASANSFPGRRFGVLPADADPGASEDTRHAAIFGAFNAAAALFPDIPPMSIAPPISRGHMLLGARHAARFSVIGHAAKTTAGLLVSAGWNIHSIRLTVPFDVTTVPEDLDLQLLGSADERVIDCLSILGQVSDRNFYADVTKPDSPFAHVKLRESGKSDIPFNRLFDAIVHLGGPASI